MRRVSLSGEAAKWGKHKETRKTRQSRCDDDDDGEKVSRKSKLKIILQSAWFWGGSPKGKNHPCLISSPEKEKITPSSSYCFSSTKTTENQSFSGSAFLHLKPLNNQATLQAWPAQHVLFYHSPQAEWVAVLSTADPQSCALLSCQKIIGFIRGNHSLLDRNLVKTSAGFSLLLMRTKFSIPAATASRTLW